MLDERILTLARRTAGLQLAELDRPLELSAQNWKRKLHAHGHLPLHLMELYEREIAAAPELQEQDRRELVEFADEAAGEIGNERPNTRRLALTLQSLAAAVQGIASGPGAYEVLRSAAAAIGIPV